MLVVPEAIFLGQSAYDEVNQAMLTQASQMKDRIALIDTRITTVPKTSSSVVSDAATAIGNMPADATIRRYGAVYYLLPSALPFPLRMRARSLPGSAVPYRPPFHQYQRIQP